MKILKLFTLVSCLLVGSLLNSYCFVVLNRTDSEIKIILTYAIANSSPWTSTIPAGQFVSQRDAVGGGTWAALELNGITLNKKLNGIYNANTEKLVNIPANAGNGFIDVYEKNGNLYGNLLIYMGDPGQCSQTTINFSTGRIEG